MPGDCRGVARIFQGGGGGSHNGFCGEDIVMVFLPRNIAGCLLKKWLTKEGGSRAPEDLPSYALRLEKRTYSCFLFSYLKELRRDFAS